MATTVRALMISSRLRNNPGDIATSGKASMTFVVFQGISDAGLVFAIAMM
jgi:hypothetical protein